MMEAFETINKRRPESDTSVCKRHRKCGQERNRKITIRRYAVPKSVDTAPQRRVDTALRLISEGAQKAASVQRNPLRTRLQRDYRCSKP